MKILVLGGAGYLGSSLIRHLVEKGHQVRVIDRLMYGDDGIRDFERYVQWIPGDIRDSKDKWFEGIDVVVNVAGLSNDPTAEFDPVLNHDLNVVATVATVARAKNQGVKRYVFASSCSVYDGTDGYATEETPVAPDSAYAGSKRSAEKYLLGFCRHGIDVVILRKGTIFGLSPRLRLDLVVNAMVKGAVRDRTIVVSGRGTQRRPLLGIDGACSAYELVATAPAEKVRNQIFNVVTDNYTISEVAEAVKAEIDRCELLDLPRFPTDAKTQRPKIKILTQQTVEKKERDYAVNGGKFRSAFPEWRPENLEEGVRNLYASFANPWAPDFDNPKHYNIRWLKLTRQIERNDRDFQPIFRED